MAGPLSAAIGGAASLPPLREDLKLLAGPTSADGSPTWTLHDPARHRFFRIGWLEFEILSRWSLRRSDAVAQSVNSETTIQATEADVIATYQFLGVSGLLAPNGPEGTARMAAELARRRISAWSWLLKNYLFLRIRLLNPDRLLLAALKYLGWVFTRGFAIGMAVLAALALHLVGRQWDAYWHSLLELFSLDGILLVGAALAGAKVVHEFGHGLTARHFGCRVPAMGLGLMVLWPILWTDTTDAWRLTDKRQRMAIDAAGMAAECILAVFATLAWVVLSDGPLRTAAFLLSSSTWLVTVAVNINPLMRFDGYYLLSDFLDLPNLQERGFAHARWWIREWLFGLGDKPPEVFRPEIRRPVLAYALCAMTYRFFLFVGIAALVYHLTFKLLGLFLLAVEIWWFVLRPILAEFAVWARLLRRRQLTRRAWATVSIFAALVALLLVSWQGHVGAVGLLRAEREATIYTGEPGRLVSKVAEGARVAEGQTIFLLESPSLEARLVATRATIRAQRARIEGLAFDPDNAASLEQSWQELLRALAEQRSLEAQWEALAVRAPFAGTIRDLPRSLRPGEWLPRREALGRLTAGNRAIVEAYVPEADVARMHPGATGIFYPLNGEKSIKLRVVSVSPASVRTLETAELGSVYGGALPTRKDTSGKIVPAEAVYLTVLAVDAPDGAPVRRLQGNVSIAADRESIALRLYRRIAAIVIREADL
jgi:putative peptide zinc metalloprotease protein